VKQRNRNKIRREERRVSAAARQAAHAQLTPEQKLAKLDERLGKGVGAARERTRLLDLIKNGAKPVAKATAEAVFGVEETKKNLETKKGQRRGSRGPRKPQEQPKA
jgi:hypothetical protein